MQPGESVRLKVFLIILIVLTLIVSVYSYKCSYVYDSITFEVSKNRKIEYGTANYKTIDLISKSSGNVSVLKDINTSIVGEQVVLLQLKKDNILKNVPIVVEVIDSVLPVIEVEEEIVYVNSGKKFDIFSNIKNVSDNVDGTLKYKEHTLITEEDSCYYTIIGEVDTNIVGSHFIEIRAVDSSFNESSLTFEVVVTSHGKENTIKNIAYSLVGKPYVMGASGPNAFDCSGFVQYVYRRVGFSLGRSATSQYYNGYEVSYNDIRVGDIIIWGYDSSHITHTAIYVGNGLMVHAANPNDGVLVNKVAGWGDYTYVHIVSIRRLP